MSEAEKQISSLLDAKQRIARLEAGYREAIEDIECWGSYASGYFQDKHDLQGCLRGHMAILDGGREHDSSS